MVKENSIVVRYGEIFLKSERVFRIYERKLIQNILDHLKTKNLKAEIKKERGRIFLFLDEIENATEVLKNIFGITSFSPAIYLKTTSKDELVDFIKKNYEEIIPKDKTFAIRVNKAVETNYSSKELESYLGSFVERKVDLENPDMTINFDIRKIGTFVYTKVFEGVKGLPISSSGKVISLISGGIDSPVASFFAMKRGCKVIYLHFSSFPVASTKSIEKVREIVKILKKYQIKSKLYISKIGEYQMKIRNVVEPKYLVVLYRRLMLRVAEKVAELENAKALVTGESLAQVSSQTLHNMKIIESVTKIPILRPLIGFDKEEIVKMARSIGTYETSILPCEDTCALFAPKHSSAAANENKIKVFEKKAKIGELVKKIVKELEVETI